MKSVAIGVVFLAAFTMLLSGCKGHERASAHSATETIAPAAAQPDPTGTDAMTQTVDVEDSRSEAEGGALTNGTAPSATATTQAVTTAPPPPAPAAPKKKH